MSFDKIKILWIEDQPDSGNPPRDLGEYADFFEININSSKQNDSVQSIKQYSELVELYHKGEGNDLFPVEIIAADYDLSKYNPSGNTVGKEDLSTIGPDSILPEIDEVKAHGKKEAKASKAPYKPSEHDGCIINVQYVTEFGKHPCGSVVTTYQSKEERHKTAKYLEDYLIRAWGVDVSSNDGKARTWKNILETGVKALRKRIEDLFDAGDIVITITDLMKLAENPQKDATLTIVSPHATRSYCVWGLFVDIDEEKRGDEIQKWATTFLSSHITLKQLSNASKLENEVWTAYNDDTLVENMNELSRLYIDGNTESERYSLLKDQFGLAVAEEGYNQCNANWCDIRHGDYTKEERRWAALFLIRRLYKRITLFMKNIEIKGTATFGETSNALYPAVDKYDIMLLLFPIPKTPFPLPWFISDSVDRANAFGVWQDRWMPNNLKFKPAHILKGEKLTTSERHVLKSLAVSEDGDLGDTPDEILSAWKSYEPAKLFMFGKEEK